MAGEDAEPSPSAKVVEEGLRASREYSLGCQTILFTWLFRSRKGYDITFIRTGSVLAEEALSYVSSASTNTEVLPQARSYQ